jgi:glutaredoxin-related protein
MIDAYILQDCYYSEQAEIILKKNKIKFTKYNVPQDEKIKNEIKKINKMNTFPQILFKKDESSKIEKIGGYTELCEYIEIKNNIKENKLNKFFLKYIL